MDKKSVSVEEFVEYLSFLSKMSVEVPAMEKEYIIVTRLYTIAKEYNIYVPPEDLALYQLLSPSFQHLKVSDQLITILYSAAIGPKTSVHGRFNVVKTTVVMQMGDCYGISLIRYTSLKIIS